MVQTMKEEYRVTKLKKYMEEEVLAKLLSFDDFIVNVDFLDMNREDYSLNKVPGEVRRVVFDIIWSNNNIIL